MGLELGATRLIPANPSPSRGCKIRSGHREGEHVVGGTAEARPIVHQRAAFIEQLAAPIGGYIIHRATIVSRNAGRGGGGYRRTDHAK